MLRNAIFKLASCFENTKGDFPRNTQSSEGLRKFIPILKEIIRNYSHGLHFIQSRFALVRSGGRKVCDAYQTKLSKAACSSLKRT